MTKLLVICNAPDLVTAHNIGQTLVKERLAACVNILPQVSSIYWWEDNLEQANEVSLLIKTDQGHYSKLEARICELHPYTLPEVIAVEITHGLPAYLNWLQNSLA